MRTLSEWHRRICCLIAGTVMVFAYAPFHWPLLGVLSLAVFFSISVSCPRQQGWKLGYLYGFAMFAAGVNWLHISINLFGGVNWLGAVLLTVLLISYLALYPALTVYLARRFFAGGLIGTLLALSAGWTITEWLRGWLFTGFPWLNLGSSQIDTPLAGFAPVFGVYGITGMVCLSAVAVVLVAVGKRRDQILAVFLLLGLWGGGEWLRQHDWSEQDGNVWRVALIQAAIPQEIKWRPEQQEKTLKLYLTLSAPYWGYDFVIWPETAIPYLYHAEDPFLHRLEEIVRQYGSRLFTGIAYQHPTEQKYFNSILLLGGASRDFYHKQHLVPFGEFLPLAVLLRPLLSFLQIPMSDFSAREDERVVLRSGTAHLGFSICYEDTYGSEIIKALPTAALLVNVSNDAWFGEAIAPHQHLQIARMRALETGRYLLRATNTGISAIIDEKGRIVSVSPQSTPSALESTVYGFSGSTPYTRFGNGLIISLMGFLLVALYYWQRWNVRKTVVVG